MVTPAVKRDAVAHLEGLFAVSQRRACTVLGIDRTMVRYRSLRSDDAGIRERMRSLAGERRRCLDSCFTVDFSYLHGGSIRTSPKSRYRQWLTHKLATWQDQFGAIGCVGCGRCITWCPVGIDITEEVRTIREGKVT